MGSLWRSEDMAMVQITMQREAAHDTVALLGDAAIVQFKDLNPNENAFQRHYANDIRRCEDMERKLRFFDEQLRKMKIPKNKEILPDVSLDDNLDNIESVFERSEEELRALVGNIQQMQKEFNDNTELLQTMIKGDEFFQHAERDVILEERQGGLRYLTGVIPRDKVSTFLLLVYRASRGNVIPNLADIQEPIIDHATGIPVEKTVFIVFFSADSMRDRIAKICQSLEAHLYTYPEGDRHNAQDHLRGQLADLENTIHQADSRREQILSEIAHKYLTWKEKIIKEKAIYHTLNLFDYKTTQHSVIAEGWVPVKDLEKARTCLMLAERSSGAQVSSYLEQIFTKDSPPTHFETNKFTIAFQNIVAAYGIARYKEVNPAVISVVTFPFLFSIMFGDFGHAVILTLFAATLIIFEKKLGAQKLNEIIAILFNGRYVLLLMGLFAMYSGIIYNDTFALSFQWFNQESRFTFHNESNIFVGHPSNTTFYAFGVDPAWFDTTNKLMFYNSFKMKLSIIFAICHMMLGLSMSLFNHIRNRKWDEVAFEFIPEVLFLGCTFGYLAIIIIYKWSIPLGGPQPSLLITMTNFFLQPAFLSPMEPDQILYSGQGGVQSALLIIALISIPFLLLPIPIIEYRHHKKAISGELYSQHNDEEMSESHNHDDSVIVLNNSGEPHEHDQGHSKIEGDGPAEEFSFSEIFIKQIIHTIEYVLGAVSNTASYLRLWALSLAHAQLADVFWNQLLEMAFSYEASKPTGIALFIGFGAWFFATIGVLLIMETLSAFLHALRLHWVEFQNKFYKGDGHKFIPFSLEAALRPQDD